MPLSSHMSRRFLRPLLACTLGFGLVLGAISALADRSSPDRTATNQLLTQLQTDSQPAASAVALPLRQARAALTRADQAASSGDLTHARLLEGLAREWAELALDSSRAAQAVSDAGALQRSAADAALRVERARAMLDELAIRKARAQGELDRLREQADAGTALPPARKPPSKPTPRKGAHP